MNLKQRLCFSGLSDVAMHRLLMPILVILLFIFVIPRVSEAARVKSNAIGELTVQWNGEKESPGHLITPELLGEVLGNQDNGKAIELGKALRSLGAFPSKIKFAEQSDGEVLKELTALKNWMTDNHVKILSNRKIEKYKQAHGEDKRHPAKPSLSEQECGLLVALPADVKGIIANKLEGTDLKNFACSGSGVARSPKERGMLLAEGILGQHGIKVVRLPGGEFMMGSPEGEYQRQKDEGQFPVEVSPFQVMDTHITRKQWKDLKTRVGKKVDLEDCMHYGDQLENWDDHPNAPMGCISWNDVQEMIEDLKKFGIQTRFLTEAEAEYLERLQGDDRKITKTAFPWGNSPYDKSVEDQLGEHAWYYGNSGGKIHDVKTKLAASRDLYDVRGNVSTWVGDWYADYPKTKLPQKDYRGPSKAPKGTDSSRVYRGGHYNEAYCGMRSADRAFANPGNRTFWRSVRLVIESSAQVDHLSSGPSKRKKLKINLNDD